MISAPHRSRELSGRGGASAPPLVASRRLASEMLEPVSARNVAAARRIYEARNRSDVDAMLAECDPAVVWRPHLSQVSGEPVRGHDGIRDYIASLDEEWEYLRHEAERFFDAGNRVVAFLNTHSRGRHSGIELELPVAHVLTFEGGRCVESVTYTDRAEGLAAAGLTG